MSERLPAVPDEAAGAATGPGDPSTAADPGPHPASPAGDPFPRDRFLGLVGRLPRYLRLAWGLAGEPRLSSTAKAGVIAAAAYLASPVDVIPGVIPVLGQLDDIAVALFALRFAMRSLDPATRERQLAAAGLSADDLEHDIGGLAVTAAWLGRRGVAISRRLARLGATASLAAGRAGGRAFRRGAPRAVDLGGRAARAAAASPVADLGSRAARASVEALRHGAPAAAGTGSRMARSAGSTLAAPGRSAVARLRRRGGGPDPGPPLQADDAASAPEPGPAATSELDAGPAPETTPDALRDAGDREARGPA